MKTMRSKERWLAAIRMQPVDRLPYWPKINGSYPDAQESPFREMRPDEIHDWIGSDKHEAIGNCCLEIRSRTTVEETEAQGTRHTVFRSPHGEAQLIRRYDVSSGSWHPVDFPVKSVNDIRILTEVYTDTDVRLDRDRLEDACAQAKRIGSDALTTNVIGTSPLMHWVEWLAGVENAHFFLADHQPEVETLFDAMHNVLRKKTELLCAHSPADVLYMMENTSTTLISPDQYRRYCAMHIGEYARLTRAADRNLILHMCGHLKALLPDLAGIPAQAFEAFTSPTLGDTSLLDGRTACPDKCLVGGTNAVLWTQPADAIIAQIQTDLDALPHHSGIVVTSAGVMPPLCKPETIKQVGDWVKKYPLRL